KKFTCNLANVKGTERRHLWLHWFYEIFNAIYDEEVRLKECKRDKGVVWHFHLKQGFNNEEKTRQAEERLEQDPIEKEFNKAKSRYEYKIKRGDADPVFD
ncbi:MAG: hypothetical protein Q9162_006334, partial [Coniocarpon cinnabarinum]